MAEGKEPDNVPEPSMEEILASIRRIIADEDTPKPEAASAGDDVVELTQLVEEDGSVKDLKPAEPAVAAAPPPPPPPPPPPAPPAAAPPPPPKEAPPMAPPDDVLVSDAAATSANASLSALEKVVDIEKMVTNALPSTPIGDGKRTLESMVMELMKPMLKEWLDQNLPALVERMVQKEIERISKHTEN